MAIGRQWNRTRTIQRAPRRGPQSFLDGLLRSDVLGFTRTGRAAELTGNASVVSRTYFGPYRPGTAQRIPPVIPGGYGGDYASSERVRSTLIARARLLRSARVLDQGGPTVKRVGG